MMQAALPACRPGAPALLARVCSPIGRAVVSRGRAVVPRATPDDDAQARRRASVLGDIVESKDSLPEPDAADFFEGDQWEWLGSVSSIIVPVLIAGAVAVGVFAAKTYDTGADAVLLQASEDRPALIGPAPPGS